LRIVVIVLGVAAALAVVRRGFTFGDAPSLENGDFGVVADFRLTERSGREVRLADLAGKVWVADFIFTRCEGPCPLLSRAMAGLQASFTAFPDARLVSVSVDPVHDTPQVLTDYADRFGADKDRWLFLTGVPSAVKALVRGSLKSALQENGPSRPGEEVTHSVNFVLVDKAGHIRGYFDGNDPAALERLKVRARELL
jgi:cytochrome oxidase Cu insertion factor (SCO1/SenC/PrrC family)